MDLYIVTSSQNEIVVEKSKFIGLLYPLHSIEDVDVYLQAVKEKYKGAHHCCFAYRFENSERASDDGEPKNTAGLPLLTILQRNNLCNVLLIVVRYFGGKKLGAGRLLRTYNEAGVKVVELAKFYTRTEGIYLTIETTHAQYNQQIKDLDYRGIKTENAIFSDKDVKYNIHISINELPLIEINYNIVERNYKFIYKVYIRE